MSIVVNQFAIQHLLTDLFEPPPSTHLHYSSSPSLSLSFTVCPSICLIPDYPHFMSRKINVFAMPSDLTWRREFVYETIYGTSFMEHPPTPYLHSALGWAAQRPRRWHGVNGKWIAVEVGGLGTTGFVLHYHHHSIHHHDCDPGLLCPSHGFAYIELCRCLHFSWICPPLPPHPTAAAAWMMKRPKALF